MTKLTGLPLLRRTLEVIDSHPELWDQTEWATVRYAPDLSLPGVDIDEDTAYIDEPERLITDPDNPLCGTTCCIAGWSVQLAGFKLEWEPDSAEAAYAEMPENSYQVSISAAAEDLLELTETEANELFSGNNTRQDIQNAAEKIARARGEVL